MTMTNAEKVARSDAKRGIMALKHKRLSRLSLKLSS